ncbi:MAG: hypothetical protein HY341_01555 [Candidatus Kerfeldbacteria bacterium]|nr:hypothetical protein [Candidatus Kerfeldbacteria bacterium]
MPEIDLLHDTDTPEEGFGAHQAKVGRTIRLRTPESERGGHPSSSAHGTPTPSFFERLKRFFRGPAKPRIVSQRVQRPHTGAASAPSAPSTPVQPSSPHVMPVQPSKPDTAGRVGAQPAWTGSLTGVRAGHAATPPPPQEPIPVAPSRPVPPPTTPPPVAKPVAPVVPKQALSPEIRPQRLPHDRRDHGAVTPRTPFWSGLFGRIRANKASPPMPAPQPIPSPPPSPHPSTSSPAPAPARPPVTPPPPPPTEEPGLSVNLIPEESITQVTRPTRQLATVGIWALGAVLLSVLVTVGMTLYGRALSKQTAQIQEDIHAVETQIATFSEVRSRATTLALRTDRVRTLLNRHVYWTQFFQKLEEHTVDDVSYGSFTGSMSGAFSLDATGADLTSVTRQVYAFEAADDFINDVSALSAGLLGPTNDAATGAPLSPRASFTLDIIIQPDVLYRSATSTTDAAQR